MKKESEKFKNNYDILKKENDEIIEKMKKENTRIQSELDKAKKEIEKSNYEKRDFEDKYNNLNNNWNSWKSNVNMHIL